MRKKRVVWKLPDSIDEIPNFGSDERKRMLELWKQQKKSRKKLTKRSSSIGVSSEGSGGSDANNGGEMTTPTREKPKQQQQQEHSEPQLYEVTSTEIPPQTNGSRPSGFEGSKKAHPPGFEGSNGYDNAVISQEHPNTNGHSSSHVLDTPVSPPPSTPTIPPPGFANLSLNEQQQEPPLPSPDLQLQQQSPCTTDIPATNDTASPSSPSLPQHYFTVPSHSTNIPVDLAKIVVDSYYPCITHGHAELLSQHYCNEAQKSLSVGGAHAVCHSRQEFLLQLKSLTGSQFLVKGVVAQPGVDTSVVLLITGSVQTTNMQVLPFCHSLTLTRISNGDLLFQIHNDAMALLTE